MRSRRSAALPIFTIAILAGGILVAAHPAAQAVGISASYNQFNLGTNHIGLPTTPILFDPGTPNFGSLGLAAPGSGTSTVNSSFAYPANAPNAGNAVQMWGDGVSSITNLGAGAFQVDVTLTNFFINQGTPLPSDEYIYLNVWETFTGLGIPASLQWSTAGNISVTGLWTAGPGGFVSIEPTAIVYNPTSTNWVQGSFFFGSPHSGPGSGAIAASQTVNPLGPAVQAGQLTVGMQTILLLDDIGGAGGNSMTLPSSLHLSLTLTPVPVPEPSTMALAAWGLGGIALLVARRRRRVA